MEKSIVVLMEGTYLVEPEVFRETPWGNTLASAFSYPYAPPPLLGPSGWVLYEAGLGGQGI